MAERRRNTRTFEVERTTGSHEILDRLFVYGTLRQGQTTGGTGASGTLPLVEANGISSVKFLTATVSSVTVPADGKPVVVFSLKDENNVARKGLAPRPHGS